MMKPRLFNLLSRTSNQSFVLYLVLGLWLGGLTEVSAQNAKFFMANDKKINIKRFNKDVYKMMNDIGVPGMSLAIIENNEVVFAKGFGLKRKGEAKDSYHVENWGVGYSVKELKATDKVDSETVFSGASLSKTFLLFTAYQMVDEGLLDLDKPMYQYMEYKRLEHDERYKLITPRMILSHSSGIENWGYMNDGDKLDIVTEPGEAYIYSGEGYNYLAIATKNILGKGYSTYIKERVLEPLGLKNSYLKYNKAEGDEPISIDKSIPSNFAAGHPLSGGQYLFRNTGVNPASFNHFTAEDYAKLVLGFFDPSHVSADRRADILGPQVETRENTSVYYGPGFELVLSESDTIISHGGDNDGYKNWMFYSPVQKRGFVMMVNIDYGKTMASKLNELTVGLELDKFFRPQYDLMLSLQYPNKALNLMNTYVYQDSASMFRELKNLSTKGKISSREMNGLARYFMRYGDSDIALEVLAQARTRFPDSALTYCLLGYHYMNNEDYKLALSHYQKARALNFDLWDIDGDIETCEKHLSTSN